MEELLDNILLSDDPVKMFYHFYNENKEFKNWLLELLPEVEKASNLNQDNPWHIYNCLDHILHSVEMMNRSSKKLDIRGRKVLAYTMFFHDLGKPKCHIKRFSKRYDREVDSFPFHNKESVAIFNRVRDHFSFTSKEKELIELLIDQHDIFMFITLNEGDNRKVLTDELLEKYLEEYSEVDNPYKVMKYLIMVGRSDNLAQNPLLTKESLHLLDVMEEMLNNYKNNRK